MSGLRGCTPVAELLFSERDATHMSTDEATVKPWSQARAALEAAPKVWLSTVRPDGRPHAMPVVLVLVDSVACFATRPTSRKARNLTRNAHCVLTVATETLDLVVEAGVTRVRAPADLLRVAAGFRTKYEWDLAVRGGLVHDDTLPGSPEYHFYQLTPVRAFGYGADGLTATRWRFE
jgi:hypothetical protein